MSELLGSFGDNELSPECLDGAQKFLKRTYGCLETDPRPEKSKSPTPGVDEINEINS